MTAISSESLLADLRQLPLLTPEQLDRVEAAAERRSPSPEKIVKRLLDKAWITPFQADVLLAGKAAGLLFGDYVLLSRLGEGGMGAVFKARHVRLGRIDALKVIRADKIASKVVARRFLREIQLTADLNHPYLIKALDAGQVGKQLYLATEYIAGEDLTATVRRDGPFSVADACLVIYQTALALKHIHERGLIHRDLKPSNIMREEKSRAVKLLDLGLSNSLNDLAVSDSIAGSLTREGVMLGTPDFMAPEQARNPHGVDIRADLYGLGGTFFYLLTGRTPYEGSPIDKLVQHASAPLPKLVLPRSATPAALAAIVSRLLAKEADDRFQTPQQLIDALLALRPGQAPIAAPSEPQEAAEWQSQFDLLIAQDPSSSGVSPAPTLAAASPVVRRRSGWYAAGIAMILAFSLAIFASTRERPSADAVVAGSSAVEEEPLDELKLLRKAVSGGADNRDQLRARVLEFRAKHSGLPPASVAASLLRKLPSPLDRLTPSKDPLADVPVVRVAGSGAAVAWLRFAPNDEKLLVSRLGQPPQEWELPAIRGKAKFTNLTVAEDAVPSATPDGRIVLAPDRTGKLSVWTEGIGRTVDVGPGIPVTTAAVSPDGKTAVAALADTENHLVRVNLDSGKILSRLDHPSEGVLSLAVSPDGKHCLAFGPDSMNRVLSLSTGKLAQVLDTPAGVKATPGGGFGPDGQRLYLIGAARAAGRFALGSATPEAFFEVAPERPNPFAPRLGQAGRPTCIASSADETTVAVGTRAGRLYLYAAASGKAGQEFRFDSAVRAAAFSTHGRILAVALDDGSILLVPLKS